MMPAQIRSTTFDNISCTISVGVIHVPHRSLLAHRAWLSSSRRPRVS